MMDTLNFLLAGFAVAGTPINLGLAALGAVVGTMVGVLPGLGPVNAVAMLVPVVFALGLPPESSMILMASIYIGSEYGGRISAILINVPGEASAVMTALEGYPLARRGMAGVALSLSAWTSFIGSMLATVGIVIAAPILSSWALAFGPVEYVALMIFAFACLTGLLSDQPIKALLATGIGLSLSTIGIDSNSGVMRYTFGMPNLIDGLAFSTLVIGLFAISELLILLQTQQDGTAVKVTRMGRSLFNMAEARFTTMAMLRGSVIGFFIGLLPGAGGTVGSALAYSTEKKLAGRGDQSINLFWRGRSARACHSGSGEQFGLELQLHPDADTWHPQFRHDGDHAGCADALQHHARPGAVHGAARTCLGADRVAVHRQYNAPCDEHPASWAVCADAVGSGVDPSALHRGRVGRWRLFWQVGQF